MNCSFCDRSEDEVDMIIAANGREVCICNECVDFCNEMLAEKRKEDAIH